MNAAPMTPPAGPERTRRAAESRLFDRERSAGGVHDVRRELPALRLFCDSV